MTRLDLVAELAAANPHLSQATVELIVASVFEQIAAALAAGHRVELRGFGAFTVRRRNARTGRNPRNGAEVPVAAKTVPHFRTGSELHARLNRGKIGGQDRL